MDPLCNLEDPIDDMMENGSGSVDVVEVVEREENEREELPITHLGSEVVEGVAKKTEESMGIPGDTPPTSSDHPFLSVMWRIEILFNLRYTEMLSLALQGFPSWNPNLGLRILFQWRQMRTWLTQVYNVPVESIEKVVSGEDAAPNDRKEESPSVTDDPAANSLTTGSRAILVPTVTRVARITHLEHRASWIGCCGLLDVISGANR
ncbi:unnamed protein product [Spirodela intermedia]|uniref:Uncharacterized protein n=1 Tax=Spirodela intermedia TaxID=51605 RepID=A0A7I8JU97_SPIIN|nr:unnamed protein product [Spirodela intermedia]CAA6673193.1 unnamed protein product [Spirodela intermedia]